MLNLEKNIWLLLAEENRTVGEMVSGFRDWEDGLIITTL